MNFLISLAIFCYNVCIIIEESAMDLDLLLKKTEKLEIEVYKKPPAFTANHVSFEGTPRKHPYNPERIVIIVKPFCEDVCYYDFRLADVEGMEELSNIVNSSGNSLPMFRVWVKKGSVGIKALPVIA